MRRTVAWASVELSRAPVVSLDVTKLTLLAAPAWRIVENRDGRPVGALVTEDFVRSLSTCTDDALASGRVTGPFGAVYEVLS